MNYEEHPKTEKFVGSMAFYAIIALSLIAIGVIAWFMVSGKADNMESKNNSSTPSESYNSDNESYNDISDMTPDSNTSEIVENPVSDIPYTESEDTPSLSENTDYVLPAEGKVLKGFSDTVLQKSATYGDMRLHLGIDIECKEGAEIKSVGSGTVAAVEDTADYGKCVSIDYGNGITVKYCGMASINFNSGDKIRTGDVLGTIGTVPCECADGCHLHLESYKDGVCVSPLSLLGLED